MGQIGEVSKGSHQRQRKPVSQRFGKPGLLLYIVGQMRKRVALSHATLVGDHLIAPGKGNRLEGNKSDFLRIIQRKPDNRADLVVIDIIDQCRDQNDFYASSVDVVDRPQLYVKQVADMPMAVGIIPDTVELQISEPQPGFGGS